jgi:hypothetical protein
MLAKLWILILNFILVSGAMGVPIGSSKRESFTVRRKSLGKPLFPQKNKKEYQLFNVWFF